jgi:hypothetical protein
LEFVLKHLSESMPNIAGTIKLIAADEQKILDILSTGKIIRATNQQTIFAETDPIYDLHI